MKNNGMDGGAPEAASRSGVVRRMTCEPGARLEEGDGIYFTPGMNGIGMGIITGAAGMP
jgi:hypothetical protein